MTDIAHGTNLGANDWRDNATRSDPAYDGDARRPAARADATLDNE